MPANTELRIASRLLPALMAQSGTRDIADREADIQHALDAAALLMRRFAASPAGQVQHAYVPSSGSRSAPRAAAVDRAQAPPTFPSQEEWRKSRGLPPAPTPQAARQPFPGLSPR